MMTTEKAAFDVVQITVCVSCALLVCNGEAFEGHEDVSERVSAGQVKLWGTDAWDIHLTDMDEPFISKWPCEGCGAEGEGDRMHAVVYVHADAVFPE